MRISVRADVRKLEASLTDLQRRQIPFAASKAVNAVAKLVVAAEKAALPSVFDRPTPFTMSAFAMKASTKTNLAATVYAKPIQAAYLEPSEVGGMQIAAKPAGRAVLVPVDAATNQYGNLPKGALAKYKGRKDVFVGTITYASGKTIFGLWQRYVKEVAGGGRRALILRYVKNRSGHITKRMRAALATRSPEHHRLVRGVRLLIAFDDPKPLKPVLKFHDRAEAIVKREFIPTLKEQLKESLRTAKRG